MRDPAFIYILVNPAMDGLLKMGKTSRDVKDLTNGACGWRSSDQPVHEDHDQCREAKSGMPLLSSMRFRRRTRKTRGRLRRTALA